MCIRAMKTENKGKIDWFVVIRSLWASSSPVYSAAF